jgi:hypothetical protein
MYLRQIPLPVQSEQWQHNGGAEPYPAQCERFTDMHRAWEYIEGMHQENIAYNLLYVPGELYCLSRRMQGSYSHSDWTAGFAWYEMCGGMVSFNRQQYDSLDAADIEAEFAKLRR